MIYLSSSCTMLQHIEIGSNVSQQSSNLGTCGKRKENKGLTLFLFLSGNSLTVVPVFLIILFLRTNSKSGDCIFTTGS